MGRAWPGTSLHAARDVKTYGINKKGQVDFFNANKKFGFIRPTDGSDDIFYTIEDLVAGEGSVQEGDYVTFVEDWDDERGKYHARDVEWALSNKVGEPGTLKNWFSDKGFGFIQPDDGSKNIFCHVSQLVDEVKPGDSVTFLRRWNRRSKAEQAAEVRLTGGDGGAPPDYEGEDKGESK